MMLAKLDALLADLASATFAIDVFDNTGPWNSLDITHSPPHVERLWMQVGPDRLLLHKIYPCTAGNEFLHRHSWPSAVRILQGEYVQQICTKNITHATVHLVAGSGYEMSNPDTYHSVRPLDAPAMTAMLIGTPYPIKLRPAKQIPKQHPLPDERVKTLLTEFAELLHARVH